MTDQALERAVNNEDEQGLLAILAGATMDYNPGLLEQLMNQMQQLALYNEWLTRLMAQRLDHCWFIAFKYAQPRELLCVFECDFILRQTKESRERSELMNEMQRAQDEALSLRYSGLYGMAKWADQGLLGPSMMLFIEPGHSVETFMSAPAESRLHFDDALLNPPHSRALEWTYFHVKMRRVAFTLLRYLILDWSRDADRCGGLSARNEALESILAVARHWRTLMWRDAAHRTVALEEIQHLPDESFSREAVQSFFAMPEEGVSFPPLEGWARIVGATWNEVGRQLPCENNALLFVQNYFYADYAADRACIIDPERYSFIYDPANIRSSLYFRAHVLAPRHK